MATVVRSERLRRRKQKVPNLIGLKIEDARLVLKHRGFFDPNLMGTPEEGSARVEVRYTKSFAPYGIVVAQKPSRGQIVDSDSRVELTVSMESLADYLPALYRRKDITGSNFIEEFLWIFQHIFHSLESKIERIDSYVDPYETPEEFLPWLAQWVAFTLDGDWTEAERRLFLKKAVELYRIRGTVKGLKRFIKMYTGADAKILENQWPLDGFQIGVASTIGVDSAILPPIDRAHCFIVEVPLDPDTVPDDKLIKLHQIISQEKPAHTTYYLRFTGEKRASQRWSGPIIGQYRVTSAPVERAKDAGDAGAAKEEAVKIGAEGAEKTRLVASGDTDGKKKKTTRKRRPRAKKADSDKTD